jgi:DNA primase
MAIDFDAIKAANPLPETIERMTGQRIEKHKINCPFHEDRTPSLHVYDDGGWKCFSCGKFGDVIDFVGFLLYGENYDYHDVIDRLGTLDIKPLPATTTRPKPEKLATKIGVTLEDCLRWNEQMPPQRRAYWNDRGLTDQTINEFFLGWDSKRYTIPATYRLQVFALKQRNTPEYLKSQKEARDAKEATLRAIHPEWTDKQISDELPTLPPKYTQIAGGRVGIFNADNLWEADHVVITEGEIDCMLLHQSGFTAVTSTGGAGSWKAEWAKFFVHIPHIYILYDNDSAGWQGAKRILSSIRRAEMVSLPDGIKDVGELFEVSSDPVAWLKHIIK